MSIFFFFFFYIRKIEKLSFSHYGNLSFVKFTPVVSNHRGFYLWVNPILNDSLFYLVRKTWVLAHQVRSKEHLPTMLFRRKYVHTNTGSERPVSGKVNVFDLICYWWRNVFYHPHPPSPPPFHSQFPLRTLETIPVLFGTTSTVSNNYNDPCREKKRGPKTPRRNPFFHFILPSCFRMRYLVVDEERSSFLTVKTRTWWTGELPNCPSIVDRTIWHTLLVGCRRRLVYCSISLCIGIVSRTLTWN